MDVEHTSGVSTGYDVVDEEHTCGVSTGYDVIQ